MKLEELRQRLREPDQDPDRPKPPKRGKKGARELPAPPMHRNARCTVVVCQECDCEFTPDPQDEYARVCEECSPF